MKLSVLASSCIGTLVAFSSSAADYTSDGFSSKIAGNGYIAEASYNGNILFRNCQLTGAYSLEKGEVKHDARFFQVCDYTGKADCKKLDGNKMSVATNSVLANKGVGNGAQYETQILLEPNEITVKSKVTTLIALKTDMLLFKYDFSIPAEVVSGRGFKLVHSSAPEPDTFAIIPSIFNKNFRTGSGKELDFSLPGKIMSISTSKQGAISFSDCRIWNAKCIQVTIAYAMKWSPELRTYPAGSVFEWEFKISMKQDCSFPAEATRI